MLVLVDHHQSVHLVGNADGTNILRVIALGGIIPLNGLPYVEPLLARVLLSSAGLAGGDLALRIGVAHRSQALARGGIHHRYFDGGSSQVDSD